jgi:hypothetical protein
MKLQPHDTRDNGEHCAASGHDPRLDQLFAKLPRPMRSAFRWLRQPSVAWIRVPAAVLLICGGLLGFLPVLGFWMAPLGLSLLAEDVPPLRSARTRILNWIERRYPSSLTTDPDHPPRAELR